MRSAKFENRVAAVYPVATVLYLDTVLSVAKGTEVEMFPLHALFLISLGCTLSLFCGLFRGRLRSFLIGLLALLLGLVFEAESLASFILQQYYPLVSQFGMVSDNQLWTYRDLILIGFREHLWLPVMYAVPFVLWALHCLLVHPRKTKPVRLRKKQKRVRMHHPMPRMNRATGFALLFFGCMAHLSALGCVEQMEGPTGDALSALYFSDTAINDQVESFGLLSMIRLDAQHVAFGIPENPFPEDLLSTDTGAGLPDPAVLPQLPTAAADPASGQAGTDPGDPGAQGEVLSDPADHGTGNAPSSENGAAGDADAAEDTDSSADADAAKMPDTSPNVWDIDFDALQQAAPTKNKQWLNEYLASQEPTRKNEYTGMFAGYNLVFLTAEGFDGAMIDPELTPMLYRMSTTGFVFENFYSVLHYTSTSGGEYRNLVGLYPKNGPPISMSYAGEKAVTLPLTLGNQLRSIGYTTIGFHNNHNMYGRALSHPRLGYDWRQFGSGYVPELGKYGKALWPQSDLFMAEQTLPQYADYEPFHVYYMTVSGHMPYTRTGDSMAARNFETVRDLDYSEETRCYIAANLELEYALQYLVDELTQRGMADHTLFVLAPDHIPYFDIDIIEELTGRSYGIDTLQSLDEKAADFEVYRNTLIIWSPSMTEPVPVSAVCSQIDILPTVSNLMGLDYDSRLLAGRDILSDAPDRVVIMASKSWMTDIGTYRSYGKKFTLRDPEGPYGAWTKEEIDTYVSSVNNLVRSRLKASDLILSEDYYRFLLDTLPDLATSHEPQLFDHYAQIPVLTGE